MTRHPFDLLVELPASQIRLDCAALHLARDRYAQIDVAHYLSQLDELADEIADRRPGLSATLRYESMCDVLVGRHGFRGNRQAFYDPQNSYFNRVLDRGLGTPITLSAVWLEVGRRLKWPVSGVALPGHFVVRFDDAERFLLADPFAHGRSLSLDDCRSLVARNLGCAVKSCRKLLRPVDTRDILSRMLATLRGLYLAGGDWRRLSAVLRRLAALEPRNGRHFQDLAAVCARLGDVRGAYGWLRAYLQRAPHAKDRPIVRSNLDHLEAAITALN